MARQPLSEVPDDVIQYLQTLYPREGGLIRLPDGTWENKLDAAARRGRQDVINHLIVLRQMQLSPDLSGEDKERLYVDIDESTGELSIPVDGYVLRAAR